ncbi:MAG: putative DNA-binding domain-containing protein [Thermomonas haemolytica]
MSVYAAFVAGLLDPDAPPPAALCATDARMRAHRYAVYRNNAIHALVCAFEDSFPVLRALLGADCFALLARDCARARPPQTPVLAEYVPVLVAYLPGHPLLADWPYLLDVARVEAACLRVAHAADTTPMPAAGWQALLADPSRLAEARLRLHPATAWLACRYAAADLWKAHMAVARPELAELDGIDPGRAQDVLIWRDADGWPRVASLPPGCAGALDALQAGTPLLQALSPLPPADGAMLLSHLAAAGMVVAVVDPPSAAEVACR